MASLYSLFDQAFVLPLELFAHTFCEGAREIAEILCSNLSEVSGGGLLAGAAREALDALLPAGVKAQVQGQWGVVRGLVEGAEEKGEVDMEEEGLMAVFEGVREEEDAAGSPRTDCAEGDCQQAPSAEPLPDVVLPSPAAASAPNQTEQRGTGMVEAEATVAEEEADHSGAREGDEDGTPGASCAEGGYQEAPSAAPLTEASADPLAAAPAPSAPHTTSLQKEQRGSGRGRSSSAGEGIFSADAFVLPSDDGTLFSDPLFAFESLPTADERALAETAGADESEAEALPYREALLPSGVLGETAGADEVGPREETVSQDQDPVEAARTARRIPPQYASLVGVLDFYPHVLLGSQLGKGGQGTVYLADVLSAGRGRFPVAAKVPSAGLPGDYLLDEALVCLELQSCPHVIPIIGFTVQRGIFIPLYALADPSPAWTQPGAGVQWTPAQLYHVAVIVYQIALGLTGMHDLGWLHADLKVENILFDLRRAMLVDFGIAVRECEAAAKGVGGTMGYLSPEVYFQCHQTKASDVYALGVVIWSLMTSSRPHYGFHDTRALLGFMATGKWFAWPDAAHAYGGDLVALVERCCHQDPSQRPSARHVADHLLRIAELLRAQCTEEELEAAWGG